MDRFLFFFRLSKTKGENMYKKTKNKRNVYIGCYHKMFNWMSFVWFSVFFSFSFSLFIFREFRLLVWGKVNEMEWKSLVTRTRVCVYVLKHGEKHLLSKYSTRDSFIGFKTYFLFTFTTSLQKEKKNVNVSKRIKSFNGNMYLCIVPYHLFILPSLLERRKKNEGKTRATFYSQSRMMEQSDLLRNI